MISNRPYLLRAFYEWIVDSRCTPILVLDATNPRCQVPKGFAEGGEIVFNISATAIRDLKMTNQAVEFKASFSGVIHIITAPIRAVLAVYAEENGEGLFFDGDEDDDGDDVEAITQLTSIDGALSAGNLSQELKIGDTPVRAKPFLKLVE